MLKKLTEGLIFLTCVLCWSAGAQDSGTIPSVPLDARTLRVQAQVEEVFERRDYDRAFFIYRNELAPIGDKYGQYMVGFMYLTGKGVPEDRVFASAWYRLAAERGTKEFVQASFEVMRGLNSQQAAMSDRKFVELRKEYGDLALLMKAVRDDYKLLKERTGSRLSANSSPLLVLDPKNPSATRSGAVYYHQIRSRMRARLEYIIRHTKIEIIDVEIADLETIEARVTEHLEELH